MGEQEAFQRLKRELSAIWLADRTRVEALSLSKAERATRASIDLTLFAVARRVDTVEEPAGDERVESRGPVELWEPEWPSTAVPTNKTIAVRSEGEICACPRCAQHGSTQCGVCHGSGKTVGTGGARSARCAECQGNGMVTCPRCRAKGRLFRYKVIQQTAVQRKHSRSYPNARTGLPRGGASGTFTIEVPMAFASPAAALAALSNAAPGFSPPWVDELAKEMTRGSSRAAQLSTEYSRHSAGAEVRVAWLVVQGTWYEGWEVKCASADGEKEFFLPDGEGPPVGPRLSSSRKIAGAIGAAAALLVVVFGVVLWQGQMERREAQARAARAEQAELAASQQALAELRNEEAPARLRSAENGLAVSVRYIEAWEGPGSYSAARAEVAAALADLVPLTPLLGTDVPGLDELHARVQGHHSLVERHGDALRDLPRAIELLESAKKSWSAKDYSACQDDIHEAQKLLDIGPDVAPHFPQIASLSKELARMEHRVGPRAEHARRMATREAELARRAAEEAAARAERERLREITVTAASLVEQYERNEVAADNRYRGRYWVIDGRVSSVSKGLLGGTYLTLSAGAYEFRGVQCFFNAEGEASAQKWSRGQRVEIHGRVDGLMGNVVAKDCVVKTYWE